jgi:cyclohexanecarboxyl-CoA dehydrogenase
MPALWALPSTPILGELQEVCTRLDLPRRYRALDREPKFPEPEFRGLGQAGLLGLTVAAGLGGRALPVPEAAASLFHLARLSGTAFAKLSLQPEFCSVLRDHGSQELVDAWYRPLLEGRRLVGNQITEPGAGADASALETVAAPAGDGYRLTGTKSEAAFALDAHAAIVYARRPGSRRSDGVSAFLVPQDLEGVRRTVGGGDLGERWQRRGRIEYENVLLPRSALLGEEGAGFGYLQVELARERGLLGAIYLGVARASWEETVAHVGSRQAFHRSLSDQEGVAFPLVADAARLEAAWLLVAESLARLERGDDALAETALAKVMATEVALATIDRAIQFHGGRGYSSELPHEQRWRDVRSGPIAHGPSEVLNLVAARRIWPRAPS